MVGALINKNCENLLTPTKKRFNPDFWMSLFGLGELSFGVLFGAFRRTLQEQNIFQKFWGSILTPRF